MADLLSNQQFCSDNLMIYHQNVRKAGDWPKCDEKDLTFQNTLKPDENRLNVTTVFCHNLPPYHNNPK